MIHQCHRWATRLLIGLLGTALAATALASPDYPTKPIRMVIPLAAGSAVDKVARVITQQMSITLGQPIVIENQPGASGLIGADRVAKAEPDGYTLGGFNDSILTMVPHLYRKMPWNPLDDFRSVSLVATVEWGLVVPANSPFNSAADLIEAARRNPGEVTFGSGGNGSPQHIAMALFAGTAGVKMMHVPYKGATPAAIAVGANEVEAGFQGLGTVVGLIQSGKVKLLAVSTPERLPQFANVPTVKESGLPGFTFDSWFLIVAPAGTSPAIADRLSEAARLALDHADVKAQLTALGMTPRGSTPAELARQTRTNLATYERLIHENGIQPE